MEVVAWGLGSFGDASRLGKGADLLGKAQLHRAKGVSAQKKMRPQNRYDRGRNVGHERVRIVAHSQCPSAESGGAPRGGLNTLKGAAPSLDGSYSARLARF